MLTRTFGTVLVSSMVVLGGCSSATTETGSVDGSSVAGTGGGDMAREIDAREARIRALEQELSSRESRIAALEDSLSTASSSTGGGSSFGGDGTLFPPNARPGECYARVLFPEKYRTSDERVLVKEASERFEVIPARYETVTERVLVKEASTKLEVVPATYETVTEQVLVKPAGNKIVEVPATYRTVTERVLDKPATTIWKKGSASTYGSAALSETVDATGELMCLVEVPATYKTVERRVIDTPAATREVEIPAVYKTVEKRVVREPATTREVTIPAAYDTVEITKLVEPAKQRRIEIPAEYRTVTKREVVEPAKMAWQTVLCEVNSTPSVVRTLQEALDKKGYNVGGIDGQLGPTTIKAVNQYAKSLNIPQGRNYVPMEVLENLGIDI
ncbi:MAG: peptidoglycan-binding domain-containing protein [Pseudomonadota bacterium]